LRSSLLLWALGTLFTLRVVGQALVAFLDARFLPPMEAWYSGLIPYPYLLSSQLLISALMAKICADFTRRRGFFYEPRRLLAMPVLVFGYAYLAAMIARAVLAWDRPIPIVFHWVLALFVLIVGHSHRRRLGP
jgi:hypothetical protein